jgi:hypothetical protein
MVVQGPRTGEVFVSTWLSDRIAEEAGRRIYESQQSRLLDQTTFAATRAWRSDDVPEKFWDSYVEDARAALSLMHRHKEDLMTNDHQQQWLDGSTSMPDAVEHVLQDRSPAGQFCEPLKWPGS